LNNNQFNRVVDSALSGCEYSTAHIKVYFSRFIERISMRSWHLLNDPCKFEDDCYHIIEDSIQRFDRRKGDFVSMVKYRIYRWEAKQIKRQANRVNKFELVYTDAHGAENQSLQLTDILADVEETVIKKVDTQRKITLLAKGDRRKSFILNLWGAGYTNESEISTILANRFGGNSHSHRKYIQRFRKKCQESLAETA
jgi:hypothetical protein